MKLNQISQFILNHIVMQDKEAIGIDVRLSNDKQNDDYFMLKYKEYDRLVFTIHVLDKNGNFTIINHIDSYNIETNDYVTVDIESTPQPNEFRDVKRRLITSLLENINNISPEIDKYLATLN